MRSEWDSLRSQENGVRKKKIKQIPMFIRKEERCEDKKVFECASSQERNR